MSSASKHALVVNTGWPQLALLKSRGMVLSLADHAGRHSDVPDVSQDTMSGMIDWVPRILIVDDEPDVRGMLRDVLDDEGYALDEARDGLEGLAAIRVSPRPLVVLLDYKMPRMNGAEVLQAVMADPHLAHRHAFILVTANRPAFSPELQELLAATAIPVIEKPFSIESLLTEIELAIGQLRASTEGLPR